ncbi:probable protein phosphatase 2C 55 [Mercurialis annua]|uniref:probable protein phosphatase 2C 55 n=1 Tax=Mercurialis annua TaxID=3986 RepID=UPI002160577A|nr:probable protein phosphatase 2C 55 [Mercurialis annua]XP_050210700.1 probable protein phosphatase 2C 55 [Mercurialis annua]XP_050210709.1 probable protein phosphatase 2C 55 [Mercurialis annua]
MPSTYFTRLRAAAQIEIRRSVVGQDGGLRDSTEFLFAQVKSRLFSYRLFHSVRSESFAGIQALLGTNIVFAARSDSLSVHRKRNISVVGALSRTFSVPSVSGPSFQVCGYHIDRALSDTYQISNSGKLQNKIMAACSPKATVGGCFLENLNSRGGHLSFSSNNASISYGSKTSQSCRNISMSLKNQGQSTNSPKYGYFVFNVMKKWRSFSPHIESGSRYIHSSSPACLSAGTAPDVTFENSGREEQLETSSVSSEQKISAGKKLKLISGSCYLPHPDKEETGGEDAHFICTDEQAVGVADGVGGWADLGVDSGKYSRELMSNSVSAIQDEPKGSIDPARVLEKAHSSTKAKGSSTACIIALAEEGLHAINLGDSGFIVVRDGCTVFRSPVQQHDFNFTYQLESGENGDLPSSGQVFTIPVAPGDVIVAGTDGLFDNLYNNEITAVVVHATRAGLEPQVTAQKIAALARQRAQDKNRQTPFSTAAQDAGFRYYGGKLDDITVVVSFITSAHTEHQKSSL